MFFSVIVPIYNVSEYLPRCIESVLCQTFGDFELILVDDGSRDDCGKICDEYAKKDERIKVVHKEHGGLVSARQAGVRKARGQYIMHLDGDDAFLPDALESAYEIIEKHQPDVVAFAHKPWTDGVVGDTVYDYLKEGLYVGEDVKTKLHPKILSDENMESMLYFLWGKALRREMATYYQVNISTDIVLGEDVCCTAPCYFEAKSVYVSKKAVYLYTIRQSSLSNRVKPEHITHIENTIKRLQKLELVPADFDEQVSRYSFFMCFTILASAAEKGQFRDISQLKKRILGSLHIAEIKKAKFKNITPKTRIGLFLMKRKLIGLTFCFLYLCKLAKQIRKG